MNWEASLGGGVNARTIKDSRSYCGTIPVCVSEEPCELLGDPRFDNKSSRTYLVLDGSETRVCDNALEDKQIEEATPEAQQPYDLEDCKAHDSRSRGNCMVELNCTAHIFYENRCITLEMP